MLRWLAVAALRIRSLFKQKQVEQELDRELRDHIEHLIDENIARFR